MARAREVAFELECFEWADERLEVAGRWKGLGSHRLNRPVLSVDIEGGRRKRIVALPGGHVGVAGEPWRAAFSWPGDPASIAGAELEVGGNIVVDLPLPDRKRRRRRRSSGEQQTDDALRAETVALHGQVERLRAELAGREREIIALRAQLDEAGDEQLAPADAEQRTVEVQRLSDELERLRGEQLAGAEAMTVEVQRIEAERDAAVAAERARWQGDIDELREAFADAAAEAEESRDRHRAELAALDEQLAAERAEVSRLTAELAARDDAVAEQAEAAARERAAAARDEAAARERAAAPPTEPMPPPDAPLPAGASGAAPDDSTAGPDSDEATARGAGDEPTREDSSGRATQPMPPPAARGEVPIEAAVLDAPGPLRAGSRPVTPPGDEVAPIAPAGSSAFQALKARFEGLFASNGDGHDEETDEEPAVPRPLRTASAARARAGATVAARRSPGEVWATRVLAAVVVAVLLTAFVLILAYIA
jgi:hypothetical protein